MAEGVPADTVQLQRLEPSLPDMALLDLVRPPGPAGVGIGEKPVVVTGAAAMGFLVVQQDLSSRQIRPTPRGFEFARCASLTTAAAARLPTFA